MTTHSELQCFGRAGEDRFSPFVLTALMLFSLHCSYFCLVLINDINFLFFETGSLFLALADLVLTR